MFVRSSGWKIALIATYLLSACGGGGGGGSSSTSSGGSAVSAAAITVSDSNSATVGGTAADAASSASAVGTSGSATAGGASINVETKKISIVKLVEQQLLRANQQLAKPPLVGGVDMAPLTLACTKSGSQIYNFSDSDASGSVSVGDVISVSFVNCVDFVGHSAVNGGMSMALTGMQGNPATDSSWALSAKVSFTNFVVDGEQTSGYTMMDINQSGTTASGVLSSGLLTITKLSSGSTYELSDFKIYVTDKADLSYTTNIEKCLVYSSKLNGKFNISTPTALTGNLNNNPDNPTAGVILIKGANNSQMRVTAVNNTNAQLEVDADGDGTFSSPVNKTWVELDAL